MEEGRLGARNWIFSNHINPSNLDTSVPEGNTSGYKPNFLKMSAYSKQASSMEFPWFPQRSFLPPTRDPMQHVNEEVNDMNDKTSTSPENTRKKGEKKARPAKVRTTTKTLRLKEPKKPPTKKRPTSISSVKKEKRKWDDSVEGAIIHDFSSIPVPVCSCTGVPHQCYRWGSGGWQSSCCTTKISEYPLPRSSSRPSARLAGRKMSIGAYAKLLQRLASEGCDLSNAVDLKEHWARHGTNKFVTIR